MPGLVARRLVTQQKPVKVDKSEEKIRAALHHFSALLHLSRPRSVDNTCGKHLARVAGCSAGGGGGAVKPPLGVTGMFHTMTTVRGLAADATAHMGRGDGDEEAAGEGVCMC